MLAARNPGRRGVVARSLRRAGRAAAGPAGALRDVRGLRRRGVVVEDPLTIAQLRALPGSTATTTRSAEKRRAVQARAAARPDAEIFAKFPAADRADLSRRRAIRLGLLRSIPGDRARGLVAGRRSRRSSRASAELSVVIPTYRPARHARFRVLDALGRQTRRRREFEVRRRGRRVERRDAGGDSTSYSPPYPFRLLSQENAGPPRARNRGVREARGRDRPLPRRRHGAGAGAPRRPRRAHGGAAAVPGRRPRVHDAGRGTGA